MKLSPAEAEPSLDASPRSERSLPDMGASRTVVSQDAMGARARLNHVCKIESCVPCRIELQDDALQAAAPNRDVPLEANPHDYTSRIAAAQFFPSMRWLLHAGVLALAGPANVS